MKRILLVVVLLPAAAFGQARPATDAEVIVLAQAVRGWLKTSEPVPLERVRMGTDDKGVLNACGLANAAHGTRLFHALYVPESGEEPTAVVTVMDDGEARAAEAMCGLSGLLPESPPGA